MTATQANDSRIILTSRGAATQSLRRAFGPVLALRAEKHDRWGWWCAPNDPGAARFESEYEARCWVHRTFSHPIDRRGLHTEEVPGSKK